MGDISSDGRVKNRKQVRTRSGRAMADTPAIERDMDATGLGVNGTPGRLPARMGCPNRCGHERRRFRQGNGRACLHLDMATARHRVVAVPGGSLWPRQPVTLTRLPYVRYGKACSAEL